MSIEIKNHLEDKNMWFDILNQWVLNNKKYAEELNYEDVIYWHNEMANNSCLVSAIYDKLVEWPFLNIVLIRRQQKTVVWQIYFLN